jgi:hypothetical protein
MTPRPNAPGTRDPLLQTALRRPLNKLMTRTTNPTTRSKWTMAPPRCKVKPNSHNTSKTTKIVQSMLASWSSKLNLMKSLVSLTKLHHGVSHFPNLKSGQESSVLACVPTARNTPPSTEKRPESNHLLQVVAKRNDELRTASVPV